MAKILLDACIPHALRKGLLGLDVETAQYAGLDHLNDTELLDAIAGRYDILVTLDRNLTYQQKISGRPVAVMVIRVTEQTPEAFRALLPALRSAIGAAQPGAVQEVGP